MPLFIPVLWVEGPHGLPGVPLSVHSASEPLQPLWLAQCFAVALLAVRGPLGSGAPLHLICLQLEGLTVWQARERAGVAGHLMLVVSLVHNSCE